MAKGIQDLGTGLGYLYKTKPDGTTIVAVEKNTADGVRSMKIAGTNNGPIIAQRPAVATITVNSVAGTGSITAINIAGVNQIGANIVVVSSTASVVAAQIADAINRYTPSSGIGDFTAQAIGAVVYVYSEPATGSTANGNAITVSATDPSINTSTTTFTNGSSEGGIYDSTFGYRFYIDADYNGTASPTVLTYALEITEYMTVRGLQSGIISDTRTISSDAITGMTRACAITQVFVFNQGGASSDVLAYLQVEGFAEGDEIRLSAGDPGTQIPTIEDARVTTSPVSSPNIYLTDQTPFVMDSYGSLTLQLKNYSSTGLVWVETGRSTANSVITTTVAGINTLAGASNLRPNSLYFITDLGDAGTYVTADSTTQIQSIGYHVRRVPYTYTACWASDMSAPTIGQRYRYYQNVYQSVTGAVGTAPSGDTTNWLLIAKTNNTYYQSQVNAVGLNSVVQLGSWPFIWERDSKNNLVSQSQAHNASSSVNAYAVFAWRELTDSDVYGNTVIDAVFDCANSNGSVFGNLVYGYAEYSNNKMRVNSSVSCNTFFGQCAITGNYINVLTLNKVDGGNITNNGGAGNYFAQVVANTVTGNITALTSVSVGGESVEYCVVEKGAEIKNSSFVSGSKIRYTTVRSGSIITGCTFGIPASTSNIEACEVRGNSTLTITGTGRIVDSIIQDSVITLDLGVYSVTAVNFFASTVTATIDTSSANSEIKSCTLTLTGSFNNSFLTGMSTTGTPTITFSGAIVSPLGSNIEAALDLDDAGVFSAGVLTINTNDQFAGIFIMNSTANRNISQIVNLPYPYEVMFVPAASLNFTFTCTGKATIIGNQIAGTAASFVATINAGTSANDTVWVARRFTYNTITRTNILA